MNTKISTILIVAAVTGIGLADVAELELHSKLRPLPFKLLGPFAHAGENRIVAIDSKATFTTSDGGKTWSESRIAFPSDQPITISNERALLRTNDGTLIAAFMNLDQRRWTWNNDLHDAPGAMLPTYVMRSTDDGATWTHLQKMHDDWSGCVRDVIQTKDGRVIFTAMKMLHNPGRHSVLTYSSADEGISWTASNLIDLGGQGHHGGVTEPTLIELNDGRVWMLIRTNWGEFWSGYSNNGGKHWQILRRSGIPSSSAPGILTRLASGRLMLLWNRPFPHGTNEWPLSGGDGLWSEVPVSNHREELSIALSDDDGTSWSDPVVLAKQAGKWLAYPYVFEVEPGRIWLTTMQGAVRVEFDEADFTTTREE